MIHPDSHNFFVRVMKSPLGKLIARPWFDRFAAYLLQNWFFPLSRLWAAARASGGDVDKFILQVPLNLPTGRQRKKIQRALNHFERCRLKAFSTEKLWDDYYFGRVDVPANRLPIVEEMRLDFRTAYNLSRSSFVSLRKLVTTSVLMDPPTPEQIVERFGADGEKIEGLFKLKDEFPEVEKSRPLPTPAGQDFWIRFPSPSDTMNDLVYARVHEPVGVENPPTLLFGHGICVEFDHYRQLIDEVTDLTRMGIRVIRPEAPWHGRRVLPGHYGGEQLLSRIPASMFHFLSAQHHEWATIINWVRTIGDGAVALGGSSLGAQTAKSIAVRANDWPDHLKPDALLAITHSQHIYEAATKGSLSDIWNLGAALRQKGWHEDSETAWLEKLDPLGKPCMPGSHIISVIGDRDTVTPSKLALEQLDYWEVPKENRYHFDRGHFTIPLGMINDDSVLRAFAGILNDE
jgi:pimeloyl-ACP methyl ester carboxylesterase